MPDFIHILLNGTVRGEFSGACDIQDRTLCPAGFIQMFFLDLSLSSGIRLEILQDEVSIRLGRTLRVQQGIVKRSEQFRILRCVGAVDQLHQHFSHIRIAVENLHGIVPAELLVMNLLQYVNYASDMAFQLLAEQATLPRLIGFNILSRLFSRNMSPNERDINEFIDQAITALKDESLSLRHAALNSVQRFATLGKMHETIARGALKPLEMDYLV